MKKKFMVLVFSRQMYDIYTMEVEAENAEKAIRIARDEQIQTWVDEREFENDEDGDEDLPRARAEGEWEEGEYSALAAWEASAESAIGEL